ncbi:uncharacterized protein TNCV_4640811 [Trichonephila clavipes]|nr:uncharacterized protein TNCV_4640811 [Trichonephila clavipes]
MGYALPLLQWLLRNISPYSDPDCPTVLEETIPIPQSASDSVVGCSPENRAVGSLVIRASDSRPEGLGSMPPNTLRVHTEYVVVNSVGLKSCGLSHERRDWRIFPSSSVPCRNCGGGDRGGVAIYLPFGKFRRVKSYCHLYGVQGQRQAYF